MKRYIPCFVSLYLRLINRNYRHSPCFIITIKLPSLPSPLSLPQYISSRNPPVPIYSTLTLPRHAPRIAKQRSIFGPTFSKSNSLQVSQMISSAASATSPSNTIPRYVSEKSFSVPFPSKIFYIMALSTNLKKKDW